MNYWKFLLVFLAGVSLAVVSCSHPGGSGGTGSGGSGGTGNCAPGSLGCACNGGTCDQGLACANVGGGETQCVSTGSGSGGSPGTGGSATGGATGSGGTVATGGSTGTGGSATGGSTGTGGSATGGSTGTGGSGTGTGGSGAGGNLIANGDFSQGATNWGVPAGTPSSSGVNNGEYCLTLSNSSGTVILGWGGTSISVNLVAGNYTLTFQVSSTGPLSDFEIHVGSAVQNPPGSNQYPIDFKDGNVSPAPGTSLTSYTETFSISTADPQAGIAFQLAASTGNPTVCVDNVSLIQD